MASAGTLVGAALQTAGQFYQSYAIDSLLGPLRNLPVVVFVIAVVASLAAFVFLGQLRGWLAFVIGPVLFMAIMMSRSQVPNVEWIYGTKPQDPGVVTETVNGLVGETLYRPYISSLFYGYDKVVSGFVRQTVSALHQVRTSSEMSMIVRQQLLGFMMSPEITDPGLSELLHLSLLGECRTMVQAGQEMADPRVPKAERCEWAKGYREIAARTAFHLTPNAAKYVATLWVDANALATAVVVDPVSVELGKIEAQLSAPTPTASYTCPLNGSGAAGPDPDLAPNLAIAAVRQNVAVRNNILAQVGGATNGMPRTSSTVEALADYYQNRDDQIKQRISELSSESYTCHGIWNIVYASLIYEAVMTTETVQNEATERGLDKAKLVAELSAFNGVTGMQQLMRAIARRTLRLEFAQGSTSALIGEYARRGTDVNGIEINSNNTYAAQIRRDQKDSVWLGQASLIQTAYMLPYYQGLLLFLLSLAFPFFAMLLFVPSKFQGFLIWFALWFWAKSWDIGYAIIAMLDDILYSLFVVRMDSGYVTSRTTLDLDFSMAVSALRDLDPTFDVATYYSIMSVCLLAVPIVTAQFVVSGAFGIASIIRASVGDSAARARGHAAVMRSEKLFGVGEVASPVDRLVNGAANRIGSAFNVNADAGSPAIAPTDQPALPPPTATAFGPLRRDSALLPGARPLVPPALRPRLQPRAERFDLTIDEDEEDDPLTQALEEQRPVRPALPRGNTRLPE